jgi:fructoselysine 6-kinase
LKVLGVGDNCIDDYVELEKKYPGGNALNVTVYATCYPDVDSDYVGIIGTDENGRYMLDQIKKNGIDTKHIIVEEGTTAVTKILIRDGDRVFDDYIEGVQEDAVLLYDKMPDPNDYDLIHFTVWGFGREYVSEIKKTSNALLSCDFSGQLDDPRTEIMPYLNVSFFSGSKLVDESNDPEPVIKRLKDKTPGLVVMTMGEHGSMVYDGNKMYKGEALPVEVVDTLGAGDSYIAAFLISHIKGDTIPESIKKGHQAAKEICKRLGGWGGEP